MPLAESGDRIRYGAELILETHEPMGHPSLELDKVLIDFFKPNFGVVDVFHELVFEAIEAIETFELLLQSKGIGLFHAHVLGVKLDERGVAVE